MKALITAALIVSAVPFASATPLISSSQMTTANPQLTASTTQMISNLTAIYIKYKCDAKSKLDEQIKCSIVSQIVGMLSSKDANGKITEKPSGAFDVSEALDSLMTSYAFIEERQDYRYKGFMEPLKKKFKNISEDELVDKSISVLAATMYEPR